jgi:meso-butanediol dehydrogenase / (S,S)-butanediol dehydrogenase / diacetyl reductase
VSGRLEGLVVVITGTASGMGHAAALLFASEGAVVLGADVDPAGNERTRVAVEGAGGVMATGVPVDLTDEAATAAWMDAAATAHGGIDVLYANAGATRFAPLEQVTHEDWDWVMRHELDVVFLPVKHAWRHLRARGGGSVVLVGSTAGVAGSTTNPRVAHTVARGGIVAMTRQLAAEGAAHGIRVNCVSPGLIETPATAGDLLAAGSAMRTADRWIPLGRFGRPEEVARAALFLAGPEASYVTGANLMVDGGWSAVLPGATE